MIAHSCWPGGRVVMQRTANPCMPVRFRPRPPKIKHPARGVLFLENWSYRTGTVRIRAGFCQRKIFARLMFSCILHFCGVLSGYDKNTDFDEFSQSYNVPTVY